MPAHLQELLEISSDCQKTPSHPARPDVLSYHFKCYHDRIITEALKSVHLYLFYHTRARHQTQVTHLPHLLRLMGPHVLETADNTRLYKLIELSLS